MKKLLLLACLMLASLSAAAQSLMPSTIGLHLGSQHADSGKVPGDPASRGWNNKNYGGFAGWDVGKTAPFGQSLSHQIVVGGFRNSLFQSSYYIALDTTTPIVQTRVGNFGAALTISLMSGYDDMKGVYAGGAVPGGLRIANRCTAATGCRDVLVKSVVRPTISPGLDYKPAFSHAPIFRLSYAHDSGGTGSKAVHLTSRWVF